MYRTTMQPGAGILEADPSRIWYAPAVQFPVRFVWQGETFELLEYDAVTVAEAVRLAAEAAQVVRCQLTLTAPSANERLNYWQQSSVAVNAVRSGEGSWAVLPPLAERGISGQQIRSVLWKACGR